MKTIKKFFAILLILAIGIAVINSQTDFFLNFGSYVPYLKENCPEVTDSVSALSERLSRVTDYIPTPSELMAMIKQEDLPIDPSDVAVNAYIQNSPMLSFYPNENISMIADYDRIQIFGIVGSRSKSNLITAFIDENGETLEQVSITANSENSFNKTISIPKTDGASVGVDVYTGDKPYGQFESWVYNYVKLVRDGNGGWVIEQSPVFEHNKAMYEKDKSIKEALKYTASIQSNSDSIISIAEQLTADKTTDYEKVLALHDWICSYMYYDVDSLASDEAPPYYATDIVKSRKAVCLGFATLMASLCRSIDIPCNVVSGYALGVGNDTAWTDTSIATDEQNHAWNEVYVDGRWMIVDTTWDCANKIENGEMNKGEVSHLYFDANLQFFSNNHKILEYSKRR